MANRKRLAKKDKNASPSSKQERKKTDNQKLILECFRLASQNRIEDLLEYVADDVILFEPFSNKEQGLHGKSAVRSFLNMMTLASDDDRLRYDISIEEDKDDKVIALVVFEKGGGKIKARFSFEIAAGKRKDKKISVVRVEFLDDNSG